MKSLSMMDATVIALTSHPSGSLNAVMWGKMHYSKFSYEIADKNCLRKKT